MLENKQLEQHRDNLLLELENCRNFNIECQIIYNRINDYIDEITKKDYIDEITKSVIVNYRENLYNEYKIYLDEQLNKIDPNIPSNKCKCPQNIFDKLRNEWKKL